MLERTTQPMTDAVIERPLPLIEKLEQKIESLENYFKQSPIVNDEIATVHASIVAGLKMAIAIVKQHNQETCNWRNNKGTALWECHYGGDYTSDCGLEWNTPNKLSPSENEMNFCPKCGKKLVEVQLPSEVQDDGKI